MINAYQKSTSLLDGEPHETGELRDDQGRVQTLDEVIEKTTAEIAAVFGARKNKASATVRAKS